MIKPAKKHAVTKEEQAWQIAPDSCQESWYETEMKTKTAKWGQTERWWSTILHKNMAKLSNKLKE